MSKKQVLFAKEYLKDLNGTRAAIRAGYSEKTARVTAAQLLAKPNVAKIVQKGIEARAKRVEVNQDWVVKRLMAIAGTEMGELASWNESGVTFKPSDELSETARMSVHQVKQVMNEHGGTIEIKQHDKLKALELLGKHLGMFAEPVTAQGTTQDNDYIEVESETLMNRLNGTS